MSAPLISDAYREQNRQLHESGAVFGVSGDRYVTQISQAKRQFNVRTVLDYGCGKGLLKNVLATAEPELDVLEYDPAVPGKELCPAYADMVVCGDVLEHIEPEYLDNVLAHIKSVMGKCALLVVDHMPAQKTLPDGRNAHLIQQPMAWWQAKLAKAFSQPTVLVTWVLPNSDVVGKTLFLVKTGA